MARLGHQSGYFYSPSGKLQAVTGAQTALVFQAEQPLALINTGPGARVHLYQADVSATVLGTSNGIAEQARYSAYGFSSDELAYALLRHNGQRLDRLLLGYLLGNGHRVYDPRLMRFIGPDQLSPFGRGGINGYAYCSGDPVNYNVPTGESGARVLYSGSNLKVIKRASSTVSLPAGIERVHRQADRSRSEPLNSNTHKPAVSFEAVSATGSGSWRFSSVSAGAAVTNNSPFRSNGASRNANSSIVSSDFSSGNLPHASRFDESKNIYKKIHFFIEAYKPLIKIGVAATAIGVSIWQLVGAIRKATK